MATIKDKISLTIRELFPDFVRADNAGVITFLEKYYEFMETAELLITDLGLVNRVVIEEGESNFILLQNEASRTETDRPLDYILNEDSSQTGFQVGETITGQTTNATATIRVEDISNNSRLFISSQNNFIEV